MLCEDSSSPTQQNFRQTCSFSYPHVQIERQIDSFLETFKRRSAAAMERAQSLQGGSDGLLAPPGDVAPPPGPLRSPKHSPRIRFHVPRNGGRGGEGPLPRSRSGLSSSSGRSSGASTPEYRMHHSLPHSLPYAVDTASSDSEEEAVREAAAAVVAVEAVEAVETPLTLSVCDVEELLRGHYAIITGGKSREGCPIITFPDHGNFAQLTDEECHKLLAYLASVPPLQDGDLGFVLVIDRRTDKWTAVKTTLVRVAGFFPGLISAAYVLRPSGFFQKAISEVSCKIFRDEFKFKVVVCSCDAELHEHIDRDQLTEELGGTVPYCHEDWLQHRLALEKLTNSTQETSAALRCFTQRLQDSALPNDAPRTQTALATQTAEYNELKNELLTATQHGESLLASIRRVHQDQEAAVVVGTGKPLENMPQRTHERDQALPTERLSSSDRMRTISSDRISIMSSDNIALHSTKPPMDRSSSLVSGDRCGNIVKDRPNNSSMDRSASVDRRNSSSIECAAPVNRHQSWSVDRHSTTIGYSVDRLVYVSAVQRLLVQLEETEATFDEFWNQHEARLKQCLLLRRFEADFREVQGSLTARLAEAAALLSIGDSSEQVQERIDVAHRFRATATEAVLAAEKLRSSGQRFLIGGTHCPVDSIRPKCAEAARVKQQLEELIATKIAALERCQKLHHKIDRANEWCTEGVALLASHQLERCQSAESARQAARKIEIFLDSAPQRDFDAPIDLFSGYEDVSTPETRGLLQQIVKRMEDVELMCQKRKSSLKNVSAQLTRPINVVSPEVATPGVHYQPQQYPHDQHPQDRLSGKAPLLRNGSEGSLMKSSSSGVSLGDNLSLGGRMPDDNNLNVDVSCANRRKSGLVLKELLETERVYVSELCSVLKGYKDEMVNPEMQHLIPIQLYGKGDILFGNLEQIFLFHNDVFLRDLDNCINTTELIGLCFVQRKETFHHLYSFYCQNKPASEELRRQVGDNNLFFTECQQRLSHKLPLGAYLLKPVQRITKYQLLLKDLLQCVEGNEGRAELQEGVDTMLAVLKCLNDSMHQVSITAFPGNLPELGKLLMQGPFNVWMENKRVLRDLRLKPGQRHLFLYEKLLLFTKPAPKDNEKTSYQFKCALKMSQVGLTESVRGNKGDLRKFEVWLQGRQEVYTILAPSVEVKDEWVKEIKRVLLEQFEYLKGENIKQYSARIHKGTSLNGIRQPQSPTTQHRVLRQTSSWDIGGGAMNGSSPLPNSASNPDGGGGIGGMGVGMGGGIIGLGGSGIGMMSNALGPRDGRGSSKSSLHNSLDFNDGTHLEEEEANWSSEYSASEDDEDLETFAVGPEVCGASKFLVLADYSAMGPSEVSLRDGDLVELIKVGCAGWWYVRVCSALYEGWAPAAYLERVLKKPKGSTPSLSSQESSTGLRRATSRTSVASLSSKSEDVNCEKWAT